MRNTLFDIFIKSKLTQHKPDVPAYIWDNIAAKNRKPKPLFFLSSHFGKAAAIFLLISTLGALTYTWRKNSNSPIHSLAKANLPNFVIPNHTLNLTNIIKAPLPITLDVKNSKPCVIINNTYNIAVADAFDTPNNTWVTKGQTRINITAAIPTDDDDYVGTALPLNTNLAPSPIDKIDERKKFTASLQLLALQNVKTIPTPTAKNTAHHKKYIEAYTSADYVFKNYKSTDAAYKANLVSSTALHYAVTTGIRYTKVLANGISIKAGANYSRVSEKFFAKNGYELNAIVSLNANGDTIGNYVQKTATYQNDKNIYNSIDLPIQIGYEMGNGKWHTNISTGASINILSKQKGSVINTDGLAENITTGQSSSRYRYKTRAGLSLLASVGIYYKINKHTHLLAEPYLRYSLSPANLKEAVLQQTVHTTGIRFGLRKDL